MMELQKNHPEDSLEKPAEDAVYTKDTIRILGWKWNNIKRGN
jgi:hypothetical protein